MNFEMKNKNFEKTPNSNEFCIDFLNQNATSEIISNEMASGQLSLEIEAKRPGRKGAAQTPSSPSERKSGSSKNKPGSAGEKSDNAISFSNKVVEALKNKVREHNSKHSRKVTLSQLKKVYRRGAGAFSSSHRPGMTRGQWAIARVNMFLRMVAGGKVKDSYRKADQDVSKAFVRVIDVSDSWEPEDQDLTQASLDVLEIGEFDFDSVEELYLDEDEASEKWYEI
jgi:hypothetical protein